MNQNETKLTDLPDGWKWVKLGDVCDKMTNGSSAKQFEDKVGLPISRIETIWNSQIDYNRVKYVLENNSNFIEKYGLKNNDILFSHINSDIHLGKTAIFKSRTNTTLIHGINLLLLRPASIINANFLNYQLKFLRARGGFIAIAQKSVNQSSINQAKLKQVDIVFPPLSIQTKIVEKLEALLSELDKGKAQLLTAQAQLKTYRQAVLKYAFEGKLTGGTEGWINVKLGEVIEKPQYGTSKKCDYEIKNKAVLRIPNISNGFINSTDLKYADFDENEIATYKLMEGDILTIRSNGSVDLVGKCALISKKDEEYLYAGYLIKLRPLKSKINSKFLLNVLWSADLRNQIESKAKSSSGVNNINTEELRSLTFILPPLSIQAQIVQEIESRLSVCDKLEETIKVSLVQSETLRQSILKRAFEGRLT